MILMDDSKHPKKVHVKKHKSPDPKEVVKFRWENKPSKKVRLVEVTWIDAISISGDHWAEPEDAEEQTPAKSLSVGYLWVETDSYITIVALVNEDHLGYGITIPRGMVVDIRDLI